MAEHKPVSAEIDAGLADALDRLAGDTELLYNVARRAIEDDLIELREARISLPFRRNGLVVREQDGGDSSAIRLGPEMAVATGLRALAKHLRKCGECSGTPESCVGARVKCCPDCTHTAADLASVTPPGATS